MLKKKKPETTFGVQPKIAGRSPIKLDCCNKWRKGKREKSESLQFQKELLGKQKSGKKKEALYNRKSTVIESANAFSSQASAETRRTAMQIKPQVGK